MEHASNSEFKSTVPGVKWPGIPTSDGAALLAMQYQLERSQWWPREKLEARQFDQLREVLAHAAQTVPFHRERLGMAGIDPAHAVDPAAFARLPLMTRRDIQTHGTALLSLAPPPAHGQLVEHKSGGSTGEPVRVFGTQLDSMFFLAYTLRDHLWHCRDFSGTLCAIRSRVNDNEQQSWGPATDALFATGPRAIMNIRTDLERQLEWLQRHDPAYLLSHPTNLRELARLSIRKAVRLPRLKEVRCFGETLPGELRALCKEAWDARVTDVYSAEEVGYIALQCPEHEHYHAQSEHLLVEVLDDLGKPCEPGAVGRVVVTSLHNFAMPLLRYELGDYAEVGTPCGCGRGLPVLKRILGRSRNMLTLPDGQRFWPSTPAIRYAGAAPIRQLQIIQATRHAVEARFVVERELLPGEEDAMVAAIHEALGFPFAVTLTRVDAIQRSPSMKFEDFVSLVAADEAPLPEKGAMTIEIRGMHPSDLSQVMRLLAHWNIAPMEPSSDVPVPERTELIIDNAYVALEGERIVGVCSYILQSPTLAEGASFGVDPAYHCRGIGEKLVLTMRRGMVARGIRVVRSEADRPETIRWLVERMGCRIVGTAPKRHAFGSPGVGEWTVLEFDLARLSEFSERCAE